MIKLDKLLHRSHEKTGLKSKFITKYKINDCCCKILNIVSYEIAPR